MVVWIKRRYLLWRDEGGRRVDFSDLVLMIGKVEVRILFRL